MQKYKYTYTGYYKWRLINMTQEKLLFYIEKFCKI